jgi:hypothetical protein
MNNAKNYPLNCGTMASPPQWIHKKNSINQRNFEITAEEVKRITESGSIDYLIEKDLVLKNESFTSYVSDFRITVSFRVPNFYENITFSSENTGVLSTPEGNTPNDKISLILIYACTIVVLVYSIHSRIDLSTFKFK